MKSIRLAYTIAAQITWVLLWLTATACSSDSVSGDVVTVPLPTGHYEGPISYQGSELRVALDLRETSPGKLQAEISFPQTPGLEFEAGRVSYQEPQLRLEQSATQPVGISVHAIREGDFLRGAMGRDSIRADFVWVRRGEAAPRGFREQVLGLRYAGRTNASRLLIPDDTLLQHPAVAFLATPLTQAAAQARANYLTRRGFVTLVVSTSLPATATDSLMAQATTAALTSLRHQSGVDTLHVGCWVRGAGAEQVAVAAAKAQPAAAFVLLEGASASTRDEAQLYQPLAQERIPVLALYAGQDTTVQVRESARRLRVVLGSRGGTQIRTYPNVTADFIQPGQMGPDGQWQWSKPAAGYWDGLLAWLQQVTK